MNKNCLKNLLFFPLFLLSNSLYAWGLYIPLMNASDLGEERAGGAAFAGDASTNYSNPAGIFHVNHEQLVFVGSGVTSYIRFFGTMTNPGALGLAPIRQPDTASTVVQGIIPAFHYIKPINDKWAFGFSTVSPYGLGLSYPADSMVRYDVIYAYDASLDISPSIAYKVNPQLSVAIGPDLLYFGIKSKAASRTQPLTASDSYITNQATSLTPGWHAGILYFITPATRVGLAYHSQMITHLKGTSKFYTMGGLFIPTGVNASYNLKATIPLASLTTLSVYHDVTHRWAVMGSLEFMNWGVYNYDHVYNEATPFGTVNFIAPRKLQNTWLYDAGTSYQVTDKWLVRTGISYVQGAASNTYRDIFITDPSTLNVAIGAHYQITKAIGTDFSYGHSYYKITYINNTNPLSLTTLTGKSKEKGFGSIGGQLVWNIC